MFLSVEPSSGVPMYRQLVEQLRLAVTSGRLAADEQLPGVREIADELQINLQTVAKAYAELVREGTLEVRRGMGTFVARKSSRAASSTVRAGLDESARRLCSHARALGMTKKELQNKLGELWDEEG